jgi:acetylglutamate kinase
VKLFKYGGHALSGNWSNDPAIIEISNAIKLGEKFVIVHGGGPQINRELEIHGIKAPMVNGVRVTSPEVMEVVQRTLSGEVLRNIVAAFIANGINAIGLSSSDGNLIRAKKVNADLGMVGEVDQVDPGIITKLLEGGYTPIISPVGVSTSGEILNVNADSVAGALAGALKVEEALFATDVAGIYRNWPDEDSLISQISAKELAEIKETFSEGMIPKAKAVLVAISSGAELVRIFDGRTTDSIKKGLAGLTGTVVVK